LEDLTGTSNKFKISVHDCDAQKNNTSNFDDVVLKIYHQAEANKTNFQETQLPKHFIKYLARMVF
jgi:hypothetical protein